VLFASNANVALQIVVVQRGKRGFKRLPARGPRCDRRRAAVLARREVIHELSLSVAPRLLAILRQEVGEARAQVSANMLEDDCDRVRIAVDRAADSGVVHLLDGEFRLTTDHAKAGFNA
jgi:hypothetical protein